MVVMLALTAAGIAVLLYGLYEIIVNDITIQERQKGYIMRALYLNNSGTRWIIPGNTVLVVGTVNGKSYHKVRKVDYYESLGNFATTTVRVNGVRYTGFKSDTSEYYEKDNVGVFIGTLHLDKCRKG